MDLSYLRVIIKRIEVLFENNNEILSIIEVFYKTNRFIMWLL